MCIYSLLWHAFRAHFGACVHLFLLTLFLVYWVILQPNFDKLAYVFEYSCPLSIQLCIRIHRIRYMEYHRDHLHCSSCYRLKQLLKSLNNYWKASESIYTVLLKCQLYFCIFYAIFFIHVFFSLKVSRIVRCFQLNSQKMVQLRNPPPVALSLPIKKSAITMAIEEYSVKYYCNFFSYQSTRTNATWLTHIYLLAFDFTLIFARMWPSQALPIQWSLFPKKNQIYSNFAKISIKPSSSVSANSLSLHLL